MVTDTICCIFLNYTLEASTVQMSERALGLTAWIKKLARANNQVITPFDGVFLLLSLKMARSFPWECVEDDIFSSSSFSNVDWSTGPNYTNSCAFYVGFVQFQAGALDQWIEIWWTLPSHY